MVARTAASELIYRPRGEIVQLFRWLRADSCPVQEALIEGPAGTGKSRGIGEFIYAFAMKYPGSRIFVCRKTRASLTDSWLVTWEEKVLAPDDPLKDGPKRSQRHSYVFQNGSELVLGGLDDPGKAYGTEWDFVYCNEIVGANDGSGGISLDEWVQFDRSLRNHKAPFQIKLADANPGPPHHWANVRCNPVGDVYDPARHAMLRVKTTHRDNPSLTPEYLLRLSRIPGVRGKRLYQGLWCAAEGIIFPEYDPDLHLIYKDQVPSLGQYWFSVDFGHRAPGCLQVWGMSEDATAYRVAELYFREQMMDWWAEKLCELDSAYHFVDGVADSEDPEAILQFNMRLGESRGRHLGHLARKAQKSWFAGIENMRFALQPHGPGSKPKLMFVRDAFPYGVDEGLKEQDKPYCTEMELVEYIYKQDRAGVPADQRGMEKEDKRCPAHGIDATRYAMMRAFGDEDGLRFMRKGKDAYPPGSLWQVARLYEIFGEETGQYGLNTIYN